MSILIEHTPTMSSNINSPYNTVSASGTYATDHPYKGLYHFIGYASDSRPWWYTGTGTFPAFWKITYGDGYFKRINKISLNSLAVSGSLYSLKNFNIYGSLNDIDYNKLLEVINHPNSPVTVTYSFLNNKQYKYYKIEILESYFSTTNVGFSKLRLYEEITNKYLLKSEDKYYSIKQENYDEENQEYIPNLINSLSVGNFDNYGMDNLSLINSNNIDNFISEKFNVNILK